MKNRSCRGRAVLVFCMNQRMERKSNIKRLFIDKTRNYPATKKMMQYAATTKLQKWWKRRHLRNVANGIDEDTPGEPGYIRYHGKNVLDPVTMDKIEIGKGINYYMSETVTYVYDVETLIKYFVTSRIFQCPCTRREFNQLELKRLVYAGQRLRLIEADMLAAMICQNRERLERARVDRSNELLAIESVCDMVLRQALQVCNNTTLDYLDAYAILTTSLLVEWAMFVDHYAAMNINDCHSMLLSNYETIKRLYELGVDDFHMVMYSILRAVIRKLNFCRRQLNLQLIILNPTNTFLPIRRRRFYA